jgi:anti-sigma28 factor (negative regulator of flagellin synthesis)
MVIDKIGGAKPQDIGRSKGSETKDVRAKAGNSADSTSKAVKVSETQVTAEVSERSKAAIKAYRIASESKPYIGRASKVAAIKAKVLDGSYAPSSSAVTDAVLQDIAKKA